jgi:IS1 family transposase
MIHYVRAKRVQRDEIWSFSYAKGNNLLQARAAPEGAGNVWTWTRVDADSKLIVTWYVGDRHQGAGARFMNDLRWRPANKVQLTTDGPKAYLTAIESRTSMPTTQCWLSTSSDKAGAGRYTPPICIGMTKHTLRGTPIRNTSARRMLSARTSPCACQ